MNTIRKGKIAKLPRTIREQLNVRLDDGMEAEPLLAWVNGLTETQQMLAEKFEGNAITSQNLSEWRQGGHQDWLRAQQTRELAELMREEGQDLESVVEGPSLNERLGVILSLELAGRLRQWQRETGEPQERWRQLRQFLGEFAVLRREEQRAERAKLARERMEWEVKWQAEERQPRNEEAREAGPPPFRVKVRKAQRQNLRRGGNARVEQEVVELTGAFRQGEAMPAWAKEAVGEQKPEDRGPKPEGNPKSEGGNPKPVRKEPEKLVDPSQEFVARLTQSLRQLNESQSHQIQANPTIENEAGMTNDECPMTKEARSTKPEKIEDPPSLASSGATSPPAEGFGAASENPPSPQGFGAAGEDEKSAALSRDAATGLDKSDSIQPNPTIENSAAGGFGP